MGAQALVHQLFAGAPGQPSCRQRHAGKAIATMLASFHYPPRFMKCHTMGYWDMNRRFMRLYDVASVIVMAVPGGCGAAAAGGGGGAVAPPLGALRRGCQVAGARARPRRVRRCRVRSHVGGEARCHAETFGI